MPHTGNLQYVHHLVGGEVAAFAIRVRFFQCQGYDPATALSSGAIASTASWVAKGLLFLGAVGFAAASFHPPTSSSGHQTAIWIVVGVVLAAGIAASAVAARSERTSSAMGDADPAMAPQDTG